MHPQGSTIGYLDFTKIALISFHFQVFGFNVEKDVASAGILIVAERAREE